MKYMGKTRTCTEIYSSMQPKFMSVGFFRKTMNTKVIIVMVLCASLAISTSEDLILPQLRHLTGKTDKTEKNKMFPPLSFRKKSSSSSQTQNEYSFENEIEMDPTTLMKKHTVVVLDPELKITCGGIILPLNRILIPHECWQNKVRKYTAIIQHRFLKSGVRTYFLKAIIGTTGLSLDINAVELSTKITYGERFDNQLLANELSSNQFGRADTNQPAYGVQILEKDWEPKVKKFVKLTVSENFLYVIPQPGEEIPGSTSNHNN